MFETIADSLCELIRHPAASETLRLALLRLQSRLSGEWREPADQDLAHAFREPVHRITEIAAGLRAEFDQLIDLLVPPVALIAGIDNARQLLQSGIEDREQLQVALSGILGEAEATKLLDVVDRALGIADVRRALEIPLSDFNRVLRELERPPLRFPEEHKSAFRSYVSAHRDQILDAIRCAEIDRFERIEPPLQYATLRAFPDLAPDPSWLDDYEEPPEDVMATRIQAWLHSNGIEPGLAGTCSLPQVDEARAANQSMLSERFDAIRQVARAWSIKQGVLLPAEWTERSDVRQAMEGSGCLDFAVLSERELLGWLRALDLWPQGMPLTLDTTQLELSSADLDDSLTEQKRIQDERARARRSIAFDGREYDVESEALDDLIQAVRESIDDRFLLTSRRVKRLVALGSADRSGAGSGRGGRQGRRTAGSRGTEAQRAAIGLVGELLAYEWLRYRYEGATSDTWVSSYREAVLGGVPGDDSLGYDFEIALASRTLLFEVKATAGDQCEFEMGESELRAASSSRKGTYLIIFIRNVLDSHERELMVLPNPLEVEFSQQFRQSSGGIRFAFEA